MRRPMLVIATLLLVAFSVPMPTSPVAFAAGRVIDVPGDYSTIVKAVEAAVDGDTVRVAPGTYEELVIVDGKDVSIVAPAGYRDTGIEGGVVFRNGADGELRGFRIQFAYTGVRIERSSPRIAGNWIIENAGGGGVRINGPAAPLIEQNIISANWGCEGGSGIGVRDAAPIIKGNWIAGNRAQLLDTCIGGGIVIGGEPGARIVGNRIENNYSNGPGAAIYSYGDVVIKDNFIRLNFSTPLFADDASAVAIESAGRYSTTVRVFRNVVVDNEGIGVKLSVEREGIVVVNNNLIIDNRAEARGAGVTASVTAEKGVPKTAKYRIINNTVSNNQGASSVWTSGFHQKSAIRNNVVIPADGFAALECSTQGNREHAPPKIDHNDLWAPEGFRSVGRCPGVVGVDDNIAENPGFDDPDVGFRPLPGSPLIDAGSAVGAPDVDLGGLPRPGDGDGDEMADFDIGAYEYQVPTCRGLPATIVGTRGSDHLVGTSGVDVIVGYEGGDLIQGLEGDDVICAGTGDDRVEGGPGNDYIRGGPGGDDLDGGSGDDRVIGGPGRLGGAGVDVISGGAGADHLQGKADRDIIDGGPDADRVYGGPGDDDLEGGDGDDAIHGGGGNDELLGKPGDDKLFGDAGSDSLKGGKGSDSLDGGPGQDACSGEAVTSCEGPI